MNVLIVCYSVLLFVLIDIFITYRLYNSICDENVIFMERVDRRFRNLRRDITSCRNSIPASKPKPEASKIKTGEPLFTKQVDAEAVKREKN